MNNHHKCLNREGKPKCVFDTKWEAEEFAERGHNIYEHDEQIPYFCEKCQGWHLGAKNRHTPSELSNCLDRNGKRKQRYPTEEAARRRADILRDEQGVMLNVYKCDVCGGFHLTKC